MVLHTFIEMIAVNPLQARTRTRVLTFFLLFIYVCWLCRDGIQYYSILFLPSLCIQMFHPGQAKFDISWGVQKRGKTTRSSFMSTAYEEATQGTKRSMPNVILIIADDLGIHDITSLRQFETPNIDSIAGNGVNFLNAYAGHATCAPSRATLYTGRFATRFGFEFTPTPKIFGMILSQASRKNIHQPSFHRENLAAIPQMRDMSVPVNETMIAEVLSGQYNYNTYMLGKWHLGETEESVPMARGFDESLGFLIGASKYLQSSHKDIINAIIENSPIDDFLRWNLPFVASHNNQAKFQPREYMTDFLSKEASKLIHTIHNATNAKPFFITVAYNAPHNPLQALRSDYNDPALANISSHTQRVYFAMIKALDRGVGTILQALKDTNNWENTVVIFTSDNGGASYIDIPDVNFPYRGWKGTFFEGGLRVPLYLQWPEIIPPDIKVTESVSHVDVFPTILAAVSMFADEELSKEHFYSMDKSYSESADPIDRQADSIDEAPPLRPIYQFSLCSGFKVVSRMFQSIVERIIEPTLLSVHHLIFSEDGLFSRLMWSLQVTRFNTVRDALGTLSDSGENISCEVPELNSYSNIWRAILGISSTEKQFCNAKTAVDRPCAAPSSNQKKKKSPPGESFPLDGINLLPLAVPQRSFLSVNQFFSASKVTKDLQDRALFWRSGEYKAILVSQWKMQIASKPDKVWFFNLRKDPLEATNIAEQLNIHSVSDMRKFVVGEGKKNQGADTTGEDAAAAISKVFQMLEELNAEQRPPLWPSLIEIPLLVDKTSNSQECPGDEYVYWAN